MSAVRVAKPKTAPVSAERRSLLARLHQVKKQLGLDEETYRDKLEGHSAKRSAASLSDMEIRDVLRAWSRGLPEGDRAKATSPRAKAGLKEPFQRLIRALWINLFNLGELEDGTDAALDAFVARQAKVTALAFLRAHQAPAIVEALKDWIARTGVKLGDHIDPLVARRAIVRGQWSKLHALKAVHVPFEAALMNWMRGRIIPDRHDSLEGMSADQLDHAMRELGLWIRKTKSESSRRG